jgi:hypothetical protein
VVQEEVIIAKFQNFHRILKADYLKGLEIKDLCKRNQGVKLQNKIAKKREKLLISHLISKLKLQNGKAVLMHLQMKLEKEMLKNAR